MRKIKLLALLCCITSTYVIGQTKTSKDSANKATDSLVNVIKDEVMDNIPTVSLDEGDLGDAGNQNVSSVLTAGRDPFFNTATFSFSPARFRIRGYDNDFNATFMNGAPMDNIDNGYTPFGLWGGLNDVMRNRDLSIALRYNTFAFGDIGSSTSIDSRASKQRKQTQFGYANSNRNYNHRFNFYHGTGISKKGWAFVVAGSFRGASEGYIPGTFYNGYSYFLGIDKRFGQKHLLSFVGFGAPTENGRQTAAVAEAGQLVNDVYYNPAWGYQNGKKRSSNVAKTHQPVFILTDDYRMNNTTTITTAISASFGSRSTTALDWYNAADPRPDYYRYLPSYQLEPGAAAQVAEAWKNDPSVSQINWAGLYNANRNSIETVSNVNGVAGNNVTGKRSHYLVQDRVTNTQRLNINTVINKKLGNHVDVTGGASYQHQNNHYFNRINDLLGGEFYVDLNQFAERDFPSNPTANQNDLNRPNRIVRKGDQYGNDYNIVVNKAAAWAQGVFKFNKVDFFLAAEVSNTDFFRKGNVKSGLFPNNSFGKSADYSFDNYSVKGGVTYKANGRNYLYLNGSYMTRAPFFDNVFVSPRTRDIVQNNVTSETIQTVEGGYVLNAPKIRARLSGYYTKFQNQMNVLTFYNDAEGNFVNYALNNIDKVHYGGELGIEAKLIPNVTITAAAAIGRYYFDSRQNAQITIDNTAENTDPTGKFSTIYAQNYRVPGTPQEAYSLGVTYRSPKYWFVSLTGNFFDQMWLDFNPLRRTAGATEGLNPKDNPELWHQIIDQQRLDAQYTVDFFGGYSWKLPKSMNIAKRSTFLVFTAGVNNLLDNKKIVTGGFEQLRFDFEERNVNKFPPKLYYAYGLNYFASVTLRF